VLQKEPPGRHGRQKGRASVHTQRLLPLAVVTAAAMTLTGCEAIQGIFKAGVWVGVIGVVLVIAVVGFLAAKIRQ
jgi:hypothetical protein